MFEKFLKNNWRSVVLGGVILFAFFVWPTPYMYYRQKDGDSCRQSRITRQEEVYWSELCQWRPNNSIAYAQAKKEADEKRKKSNLPVENQK
jgi:hypothetical protein